MARISAEEYQALVKKKEPASTGLKNAVWAFCVGGAICTLGQVLLMLYRRAGLSAEDARTAVSVSLIFLSAATTALGGYDALARHAGAGTLVPITGFANSMVAPAMEFRSEGFVAGLGVKLFSVAGPVLVYGVTAAMVYGLLRYVGQWLGGGF